MIWESLMLRANLKWDIAGSQKHQRFSIPRLDTKRIRAKVCDQLVTIIFGLSLTIHKVFYLGFPWWFRKIYRYKWCTNIFFRIKLQKSRSRAKIDETTQKNQRRLVIRYSGPVCTKEFTHDKQGNALENRHLGIRAWRAYSGQVR